MSLLPGSARAGKTVSRPFQCKNVLELRQFQKDFVAAVESDTYLTCALSGPRGLGKTTLCGWLCARALTPGDDLYRAGTESVLCSGSIEQCRLVYRCAIGFLEAAGRLGEYRLVDSATRVGISRKSCRTRLKALGSNPKTSLGFVGVPLVVLDEPSALHETGGSALWDSILTAQGKPDSPLKAVLIGTLAPAHEGNWWPELIRRGTHGSTWVQVLQGDRAKWDSLDEALRVNPLSGDYPEQRDKISEELAEAQSDPRLKARYLSFRLNLPSKDESSVLLTLEDWERVTARDPGNFDGSPIVGLDMGGSTAWSSACAIWPSGRTEALAIAPGRPDIASQEKRDRVPAGLYARLVEDGLLTVAEGLHVPPAGMLWQAVLDAWGQPELVLCDRFRLGELRDAGAGPLVPRVTRWSDAAEDVRALRALSKDGPLSTSEKSGALIGASLAAATVKSDDQGSCRLVKAGTHNLARDDVAASLLLAAGEFRRQLDQPHHFEVIAI